MTYNDPELAFITAFVSSIETATGLKVYERTPDNVTYPYIYSEIEVSSESDKERFYYNLDVTLQITNRDASNISAILAAKNSVVALINKSQSFAVTGYAMLTSEVVGTNRVQRKENDHHYDVQIVRLNYQLQKS